MNTKQVGNIAELKVLTRLVELGYTVSLPYGDNARYDLVVDTEEGLRKVQVKHGQYKNGSVTFSAISSNVSNCYQTYKDIDYFGVYCSHLDKVYWVRASLVGTGLCLRVEPTKNKQQVNIRWAETFEL